MAFQVPIGDGSLSDISFTESQIHRVEEADRQAEALLEANRIAMEALAAQHQTMLRNKERTARAVQKARTNSSRSRSLHSSRADEELNPNLLWELSRILEDELNEFAAPPLVDGPPPSTACPLTCGPSEGVGVVEGLPIASVRSGVCTTAPPSVNDTVPPVTCPLTCGPIVGVGVTEGGLKEEIRLYDLRNFA